MGMTRQAQLLPRVMATGGENPQICQNACHKLSYKEAFLFQTTQK
jgi:hypothetical protein